LREKPRIHKTRNITVRQEIRIQKKCNTRWTKLLGKEEAHWEIKFPEPEGKNGSRKLLAKQKEGCQKKKQELTKTSRPGRGEPVSKKGARKNIKTASQHRDRHDTPPPNANWTSNWRKTKHGKVCPRTRTISTEPRRSRIDAKKGTFTLVKMADS